MEEGRIPFATRIEEYRKWLRLQLDLTVDTQLTGNAKYFYGLFQASKEFNRLFPPSVKTEEE